MVGDFINAVAPYLSAAAIVVALYAVFVRSLAKQNLSNANASQETAINAQKATIEAMQPRIDALEADIVELKAASRTDKNTISGLKGERTKLVRRIRHLEEYIKLLHGVLKQAGITAPPLPTDFPDQILLP